MAQVHFTTHLKRLAPEPIMAKGITVGEALAAAFSKSPQLRSYVLDEQGHLRANMSAFSPMASGLRTIARLLIPFGKKRNFMSCRRFQEAGHE